MTQVNMMPIIYGNAASIPSQLQHWIPMIARCRMEPGSTVYLTVHETPCNGQTQRRPGIHTEATRGLGWGGFPWGAAGGVWMASSDGACRVWEQDSAGPKDVDKHGALLRDPRGPSRVMRPWELVQISDTTPHEALPSYGWRSFFRLVSEQIGGWWAQHSTPNPLGVMPKAPILYGSKFKTC